MSIYSKKSRLVCLLLCAIPFTGPLGGHRFYLGRIKSGFLYILALFLFGSFESDLPSFSNLIGFAILICWTVDLARIIFFGLKDNQDSLVLPYINIPKFLVSYPSYVKFKSWWLKQIEEGEKLRQRDAKNKKENFWHSMYEILDDKKRERQKHEASAEVLKTKIDKLLTKLKKNLPTDEDIHAVVIGKFYFHHGREQFFKNPQWKEFFKQPNLMDKFSIDEDINTWKNINVPGLAIATDVRVMFFEKKRFGYDKKNSFFYCLYSNISSIDNLPSKIVVPWFSAGGEQQAFTFTFNRVLNLNNEKRDFEQISVVADHNHKKRDVEKFVDFVRDNIGNSPGTANQNKQKQAGDVLSQIEKLSELKDKGIITEDEFISKKEKLLTKI